MALIPGKERLAEMAEMDLMVKILFAIGTPDRMREPLAGPVETAIKAGQV
jgi:hypothetical protein